MSTPLQERMYTDASNDTALAALLGSGPFRWYANVLQQGSSFPAVVVQQISGSNMYGVNCRIKQGFSRYQFMIWGGQYIAGLQATQAVAAALTVFMDTWDGGSGIAGLTQYSNLNIGQREFVYPWPDSPIYQLALDFNIFSDATL